MQIPTAFVITAIIFAATILASSTDGDSPSTSRQSSRASSRHSNPSLSRSRSSYSNSERSLYLQLSTSSGREGLNPQYESRGTSRSTSPVRSDVNPSIRHSSPDHDRTSCARDEELYPDEVDHYPIHRIFKI